MGAIAHVRYILKFLFDSEAFSGHFPTLDLVFFRLKCLLGIARQCSLEKFAILTLKSRSHEKIEIYRTWAISSVKCKLKKVLRDYASLRNCIPGPCAWQLEFNNKMQLSLDRLNLGPRIAKNMPRWTDKEKANKKEDEKLYNWARLFKRWIALSTG